MQGSFEAIKLQGKTGYRLRVGNTSTPISK